MEELTDGQIEEIISLFAREFLIFKTKGTKIWISKKVLIKF